MKMKIYDSVIVEKEIEIEFPIYRKIYLDRSTIYMKVESFEKEICLHIEDSEEKMELEISKPSFRDSEDYILGKGEYKCRKEDFEAALNSFKNLLESI